MHNLAGITLCLCINAMSIIAVCLIKRKKPVSVRRSIGMIGVGNLCGAVVSGWLYNPLIWVDRIGTAVCEMLFILCCLAELLPFGDTSAVGYDDGVPPRFFITGDKHRNFNRVKRFCRERHTRRQDVLIVLGDAGFNYFEDERDDRLKKEISKLPVTLFCLHGNKEKRPQNIATYGVRDFCGGRVYYEPKYPNIYFAVDGEIYTFEGKRYMVIGGAHSVDKMRCLDEGLPYWEDEMPDAQTKSKVEERLLSEGNRIFGILTHTCPIGCLPTEMFISTCQNTAVKRNPHKDKHKKLFKPDIDRSTEEWLGELERKVDYRVWFCGHYHIDKEIGKIHMMCHEIIPLRPQLWGERND